jgi:hypothetical protein
MTSVNMLKMAMAASEEPIRLSKGYCLWNKISDIYHLVCAKELSLRVARVLMQSKLSWILLVALVFHCSLFIVMDITVRQAQRLCMVR